MTTPALDAAIRAGYAAARIAPWPFTKEVLAALLKNLGDLAGTEDEVRAAFDAWLAEADPAGELDVYRQARKFAIRGSDAR